MAKFIGKISKKQSFSHEGVGYSTDKDGIFVTDNEKISEELRTSPFFEEINEESKCRYIKVKGIKEKVLIPGCMAVGVHYDIDYCTCHEGTEEDKIRTLELMVERLEYEVAEIKEMIVELRLKEKEVQNA